MSIFDSGIPDFALSDKYVYLDYLLNNQNGSHASHRKLALWRAASQGIALAGAQSLNSNNTDSLNNIQNAIQFLESVTKSERNKEMKAIEQYKRQLDQMPIEWKNNSEFKTAYEELTKIDFNDIKDYKQLYLNLTKAINLIRNNEDNYKSRLEQLLNENKQKERSVMSQIANDQYIYRLYGDISHVYESIIGLHEHEKANTIIANIANKVKDYIDLKKLNLSKITDVSSLDFMAIVGAITADIERFIQQEYYKSDQQNGFTQEIIDLAYQKYLEAENHDKTILQQALDSQNNQLDMIIDSFRTLMGLHYLTGAEKSKREQKIEKNKSKRNKLKNFLNQSKTGQKRVQDLKYITWSQQTNQSHGFVAEAIRSLITQAFKVHGSAGADVITIGTLYGKINTASMQKRIKESTLQTRTIITNYYSDLQKRENRKDDYTERFSAMNDNITKEIDKIKQHQKRFKDPEDIFIYHESIKMYARIDRHKINELGGRTLQILNAIDALYSANGINSLSLIDKDLLEAIALNLSEHTVASHLKNPLAKYLSIFAGLLMFDDIKNIAIDASKKITNEPSVHQIHLYLVNDQFLPGSLVLQSILTNIQKCQDVLSSHAAKVNINTNAVTENIYTTYYSSTHNLTSADWENLADNAAANTTVEITFFTSFLNFLSDIFK